MAVIAYMIGEHRVLIDEEFLPLMREHRWHVHKKQKYVMVSIRKSGSRLRGTLKLHRAVIGAKDGEHVDHKNGNVLDNRLDNLRICTQLENNRNSSSRGGSSKFKGVSICKRSEGRLWVAQITIEKNRRKKLGRFSSEEMAAKAYDEAAKNHYGEFAKLNFPEKIQEEILISAIHYPTDFKDTTTSKYRGVYFCRAAKKRPWIARLQFKGGSKALELKRHATQEEAAMAYDRAVWERFKDPSRLNFPEEYLNDDSL